MNKKLEEALLRQKFKQAYRKAKSRAVIKEESLYKAFVEPFTDVLQAANLAGQDFLNSYLTYLRMFITWDTEKGKEILAKHDQRRAKIAEKWKPLMEKTDAALSTGDADLIALVLAPQVFAMSAVGSKAAEYGGGISSFLSGVGLGGVVSSLVPGFTDMSEYKPEDKGASILSKMSILFLGAVAGKAFLKGMKKQDAKNESVITEQEKKPDFADDLKTFFDDSGASDEFKKDAKVLVDSLEDALKEFDSAYEERKNLLTNLNNASDLNSFIEALSESQTDLQESVNSSTIKKELQDSVNSLVKKPEFADQVKEEAGKDEVTEEDLKKAAQKVVFLDAKKNLEQELGGFEDGLKKYAQSMGDQIKELIPTDEGMKILKQSKNNADIINLLEKTKQKYFIA